MLILSYETQMANMLFNNFISQELVPGLEKILVLELTLKALLLSKHPGMQYMQISVHITSK